ncbi:hypothetical protein QL996_11285 [Planococcus sp. APC 4015]|nr:hypothetical protein [Planococcus sp. APC 4015]
MGYVAAGQAEDAVLIVEPNPDGHRLYYVALLARWCRSNGLAVTLMTTPRATSSAEWALHMTGAEVTVEQRPADWFGIEDIARLAEQSHSALTVIPDGDRYLMPLVRGAWKSGRRLSVLAMRPDAQNAGPRLARPIKGFVKKSLIVAAGLRRKVRVFALRSPLSSRRSPLRWVADPITLSGDDELVAAVRAQLHSASSGYWVGVFGAIDPRKNLHLLAQALVSHPEVGLLVAGRIDETSAALARGPIDAYRAAGGAFVHLEPPMDDAHFDSAICAVDCVVVAHSNEGSSGVASKAAAAGRRLVLSGARSLRRDARALGDQAAWVPLDTASIAQAVAAASTSAPPRSIVRADLEDFVRSLTWM